MTDLAEIPGKFGVKDMQTTYGYAPLGAADGPVKTAIFGANVARLYSFKKTAGLGGKPDRLQAMKT